MKLEHTAVNVEEPAKMAAWFAEHLGMRIVLAQETAPYMHFLAGDDGSMIEIYNNPATTVPDYASMSPFQLHFAFSSGDIHADRARLIAAGATPVGEVTTTPAGDQLAFLRDPWNLPFQFVQRKKPLI